MTRALTRSSPSASGEGLPARPRELRYGRLIWAQLKDRNGFRKDRPGIILTPTEEIEADQPLVVLCVTTSYPSPPPPDHIELPWNSDPRKVATRLARRSAAVIGWFDSIYQNEIIEVKGFVPNKILAEIQRRISDAHGPEVGEL